MSVFESKSETPEPLLTPSLDRFMLFPLRYPDLWALSKKQEAAMWTVAEVDLSQDAKDFAGLEGGERAFLLKVLAFFAASDAIVMENLAERFSRDVQVPEARAFYAFQLAVETVHTETYGELIRTYVPEPEQPRFFGALQDDPSVAAKAQWALKWISSDRSFAERLVAFAAVEGVFFSGSFCAIYWFKKRGLLPGLTFSNELISRDENLHCEFACALYGHLRNRLRTGVVHAIFREALAIEQGFIRAALPRGLKGMNASMMEQYLRFVANFWLAKLGYPGLGPARNPFPWMAQISLSGETNFFEKRVGEYRRAGVLSQQAGPHSSTTFDFDVDF